MAKLIETSFRVNRTFADNVISPSDSHVIPFRRQTAIEETGKMTANMPYMMRCYTVLPCFH